MMGEVFEATIEEHQAPTNWSWKMQLRRAANSNAVLITVQGARGGIKARFHVRFMDLDQAIAKIDPVLTGS